MISHVPNSLELRGAESEMLMIGDRSHAIEGAAEDPAELDRLVCAWVRGEMPGDN